MTRSYPIIAAIVLALSLAACCSSKKSGKPAKEALPDRNTKDPQIDSTQKKVDKATFEINGG